MNFRGTSRTIDIGQAGRGDLLIDDGQVSGGRVRIGSNGTGNGSLVISNGGVLTTTVAAGAFSGTLGVFDATTSGSAHVTGAGSAWRQNGVFEVGWNGAGTVLIDNGGLITAQTAYMASTGTASADVTVAGAGSRLEIAGRAYVGGNAAAAGGAATLRVRDGGVVSADRVQVWGPGRVAGNGTLDTSLLTNMGRVAPGNSPGILTINGNYLQTSTGTLEIEFGGLTPGPTGHDQFVIAGGARLAGRLEVSLVDLGNGYTPAVGDEITFLTAASRSGSFRAPVATNLAAFNATNGTNFAFQAVYGPDSVKLRVAERSGDIEFASVFEESNWSNGATWTTPDLPNELNVLEINNLYNAGPQVLNVDTASTAHQVTIADPTDKITVQVQSGSILTVQTDVSVGANGAVILESNGTLSTSSVDVGSGAVVGGVGRVEGSVLVGTAIGAEAAVFRPGMEAAGAEVGQFEIAGSYAQGTGGVMAIDIVGDSSGGNNDAVKISGEMALGGTLLVDASQLTDAELTIGAPYTLAEATGGVTGSFDEVRVQGRNDVYFYVDNEADAAPGLAAAAITEAKATLTGSFFYLGDVTRGGGVDDKDALVFATVLTYGHDVDSISCGEGCNAKGSILTALNFVDTDPDGLQRIDFFDVPYFNRAYARSQGVSLSEAYARFNVAMIKAQELGSVPEPGSAALGVLALLTLTHAPQRRWRDR